MRADNDIDRAVRHTFQRGFGGFTVVETRKAGDFYGEIGEAVGEVLRVLLDQKRGRGEYGDLFAAHYLVFGFFVAEAVGKRLIVQLVDFKLVSRLGGALSVEVEQLGGGVARFFGGLALRLVPCTAAELVQGDVFMRLTGVAAD